MASKAHHQSFSDSASGRRTAPRLRLSLPGTFMSTQGNHPCIVTNLSRVGVLIAISEPLAKGKDGFLRCGPLDHFVTVIRRESGLNALEFESPLTDAFVKQMHLYHETFADRELDGLIEVARRWTQGSGDAPL